jgi:tripartite-type tricarboxylate transporter receptor subunit TctC
MTHLRSGALIPLAVTAGERMKALPNVPTLKEAGLTKFSVNAWMGFLGPARMSPVVVKKFERDSIAIINEPAIQQKLITLGFEPSPTPASELSTMMKRDYPVWRGVITRLGLTFN